MVIFGLFHGLIFLPALLATMGPRAYTHAGEEEEEQQVRDSPKKKDFLPFSNVSFLQQETQETVGGSRAGDEEEEEEELQHLEDGGKDRGGTNRVETV